MPEEELEESTNKTFHVKGFRENEANIVFYAAPFAPEIEYEGETVKVTFNEGYIYDHANMTTDSFDGKTSDKHSIPRIKVEELEHTHGIGDEVEYSLEIKRNQKSGEVIEAKIVNSESKENSEKTFRNFIVENELQVGNEVLLDNVGEGGNPIDNKGEDSYVYMDLADFDGFELKELYLRENIHVYYRGFEQLFNTKDDRVGDIDQEGSSEYPIPILNSTGIRTGDPSQNTSTGANGMIGIRAIVKMVKQNTGSVDGNGQVTDPDPDDPAFSNILEIEFDEEQIYFFVPQFDDSDYSDIYNLEGDSQIVEEVLSLRQDLNAHRLDGDLHCPCPEEES